MASKTGLFLALSLLLFAVDAASGCDDAPHGGCHMHPGGPPPAPAVRKSKYCPMNTIKMGVCAHVMNGLIHIGLGKPPKEPCCGLVRGMVDVEAAVCVCAALKADVMGVIHLDISVALTMLLNYCGKQVPEGFQCPAAAA